METTLNAELRPNATGKGNNRKLRALGKLPAVVYGPEHEATPVSVDPHALDAIFRNTRNRNTIIKLMVNGEAVDCLVREVQRHPVTRAFEHVDFYRLSESRPVEVMVPVSTVGKSKGASIGGRVRIIRRELTVACSYDHIPSTLEVDVSTLDIGEMMKASEIVAPEGTKVLFAKDFNVVTIVGKRSDKGQN